MLYAREEGFALFLLSCFRGSFCVDLCFAKLTAGAGQEGRKSDLVVVVRDRMRQTHCLRSSSRRATWAAMRALSRSLMLSRLLCAVDVEPIKSSTSCLAVSRLSSLCFKLSRMSWASSSLTSPCSSSGVDPGWKLSLDKRWMSWNVSLTESDRTARFADTEWLLMRIKKRKHLLSFSCSLLVIIKGVTSCPATPAWDLANVSSFPTKSTRNVPLRKSAGEECQRCLKCDTRHQKELRV